MVSVTEDNMLRFKNAGGYLSFKFYGEGVSVKSITLKGSNHEKLAGKASITMAAGGTPTVIMQDDATESITLVCNEPVALNASAENYTEFWFVIPPTTFEQGFTVTVTDTRGGTFDKSTANPVTISRNSLSRMAPMEVVPDYDHAFVPFKDANFKTYCVQNFDKDGDGEISITEASNIIEIFVSTENIEFESLEGIEFMPNLRYLSCYDKSDSNKGKLTSLDVSKNTALTYLRCSGNQLTKLDVSKNTALTTLYCPNNQLTSLDVSKNTELTTLWCQDNQLTDLDVSKNMTLTSLNCSSNQLTSLDVSKNTALTRLYCYSNPYLTTIWLQKSQTIADFRYDTDVATIKYKDESDPSQPKAVNLGLPSGLKWATCNVGANAPEEYGDYFAWGEISPKENYVWATYKWCYGSNRNINKYNHYNNTDNLRQLQLSDDAARANWGENWRMPTDAEWTELRTQCGWLWTKQEGKNGYLVTGPNGNSIFLPAAGERSGEKLYSAGSGGVYWSSSLGTGGPDYAYTVGFDSGNIGRYIDSRCYGKSVRPVTE